MVIRGVLFDWGGTIVRDDSLALGKPCAAVAAHARGVFGLQPSDAEFEQAFHDALPVYQPGITETAPHLGRLLASAFGRLGLHVGVEEIEACERLFFAESTRGFVVYDDARALLASLRYRGFRTGVVTNAIFPSHLFALPVQELGLAGYFQSFVSSADVGFAKPNPGPYMQALDHLGLQPEEAIFVGDTAATDIAGARAAGIRAVLLSRTGRAGGSSDCPVIERLTALNGFLGEGPAL